MAERSGRTGGGAAGEGLAATTTTTTVTGGTPVTSGTYVSGDEGAESSHRSPSEALRAGRDQALNEAKTAVRDMADQQRKRAADNIGGMASALHKAAGDLDSENKPVARYTHMAAEQLDRMAGYLRQSDWNDIIAGAENLARRNPSWFVGGMVAAGFLAARFIKSSGEAEFAMRRARMSAQSQTGLAGSGGGLTPATGTTGTTGTGLGYGAAEVVGSPGSTGPGYGSTSTTSRPGDLT